MASIRNLALNVVPMSIATTYTEPVISTSSAIVVAAALYISSSLLQESVAMKVSSATSAATQGFCASPVDVGFCNILYVPLLVTSSAKMGSNKSSPITHQPQPDAATSPGMSAPLSPHHKEPPPPTDLSHTPSNASVGSTTVSPTTAPSDSPPRIPIKELTHSPSISSRLSTPITHGSVQDMTMERENDKNHNQLSYNLPRNRSRSVSFVETPEKVAKLEQTPRRKTSVNQSSTPLNSLPPRITVEEQTDFPNASFAETSEKVAKIERTPGRSTSLIQTSTPILSSPPPRITVEGLTDSPHVSSPFSSSCSDIPGSHEDLLGHHGNRMRASISSQGSSISQAALQAGAKPPKPRHRPFKRSKTDLGDPKIIKAALALAKIQGKCRRYS